MKFLFITLLCFIFFFANGNPCEFQKVDRLYECDTTKNEWRQSFDLGLLKLDIDILELVNLKDSITIKGRVVENKSIEGIDLAPIYLLTGDNKVCKLNQISITDKTGYFQVTIAKTSSLSIYCSSMSYMGMEVKILNCP